MSKLTMVAVIVASAVVLCATVSLAWRPWAAARPSHATIVELR